jgi:hypothetical protein
MRLVLSRIVLFEVVNIDLPCEAMHTHSLKLCSCCEFLGTFRTGEVVFRLVMLGGSSGPVGARKRDGGGTYSAPPFLCREDIGTMGAAESMLCFAVLGKRQPVYQDHLRKRGPESPHAPWGSI